MFTAPIKPVSIVIKSHSSFGNVEFFTVTDSFKNITDNIFMLVNFFLNSCYRFKKTSLRFAKKRECSQNLFVIIDKNTVLFRNKTIYFTLK